MCSRYEIMYVSFIFLFRCHNVKPIIQYNTYFFRFHHCQNSKGINTRKKKFKVRDTSRLSSFRDGYLKYYGKKGCTSVTLYHDHDAILDLDSTFASLGIINNDVLVAMENGKDYCRR